MKNLVQDKTTNLANWAVRIPQIDKQIVTFQVKVYYIFPMQIFHPKGHIHCNQETLAVIKCPVDN